MARITRAAPHLSAEEVKTRLQLDPRPLRRQRWLISYRALVDPREASAMAKQTGTTVAMVQRVIASSKRLGVGAVQTPGKGGRRRQSMTWQAERAFFAPFFRRAERGEMATAQEIKRAVEAQGGHEVHKSTISRLLKRHGWRKPVPRPVHPKAKAEAPEEFKKPVRRALKPPPRHVRQRTSVLS